MAAADLTPPRSLDTNSTSERREQKMRQMVTAHKGAMKLRLGTSGLAAEEESEAV